MNFKSIFENEDSYYPIIEPYAVKYSVPAPLIMAVIAQESSFNPLAQRYEKSINDTSYGLMQILYNTAKLCGFKGYPEELFNIDTNINYGTIYLRDKYKKYNQNLQYTVSAYNAGTPKILDNGNFKNQDYVNKVISYYIFYNAKFVELNEEKSNQVYKMILNKEFSKIANIDFGSITENTTKNTFFPILLVSIPLLLKLYKKVF